MQIHNVAYALKMRVSDVMDMSIDEFMRWIAYFEVAENSP